MKTYPNASNSLTFADILLGSPWHDSTTSTARTMSRILFPLQRVSDTLPLCVNRAGAHHGAGDGSTAFARFPNGWTLGRCTPVPLWIEASHPLMHVGRFFNGFYDDATHSTTSLSSARCIISAARSCEWRAQRRTRSVHETSIAPARTACMRFPGVRS